MKEKKSQKQRKALKIKDADAAKASADPKGGFNFTRTGVQIPVEQITDGTLNFTKTTK